MSAASRPVGATRSVPAVWLVVLGVALLVGAAAAFLTGSFATAGTGGGTAFEPSNSLVGWVVAILAVGFLGFLVIDRVRNGSMGVPTRVVVTILVVILVLILFAVIGRAVSAGGGLTGGGSSGPGANSTQGTTNTTSGGNATGTGSFDFFSLAVPYWAAFALLAGGLVVVGLVSARLIRRPRLAPPDSDELAESRREVRGILTQAAAALDDPSADPRAVLIGLYAALLARIEPLVADLSVSTPEEIRARHLTRLGIRARRAEEITRLFERARYSSHPIGADEVRSARAALADAIDDLDRRGART